MDDLKNLALQYIELLRDEKQRSRSLSDVRTQKKKLRAAIQHLLAEQNSEGAEIPDVATITRQTKRRLQPLKRADVETWAAALIGDEQRTIEEVGKLYDGRSVTIVEDLAVVQTDS